VVKADGTSETVWMNLTERFGEDCYLARVSWLTSGDLLAQVENREQTKLELLRLNPNTGESHSLLLEENEVWINLHHMFTPLSGEEGFIWASEKTGYRHLYVYGWDGVLKRQLTSGEWEVESFNSTFVDENKGVIYFLGNKDNWLERHLYSTPLAGGGAITQITKEAGIHDVCLNHARTQFTDTFSSLIEPFKVSVCSVEDGGTIKEVYMCRDPKVNDLRLPAPVFFTVPSEDGKVTLQGCFYKPTEEDYGPGPYPTLVSTYGGPHLQTVQNAWPVTADLRAQHLRACGYLVLKLDNRGSSRRGLVFEAPVKHNMGDIEIKDQVTGVMHLSGEGLVDKERVGIYGWSYGGYMSAMALMKESKIFKLAIAGAPVTHWDGYDTHYTERYMGTPQSNPDGYAKSAVMPYVSNMEGSLLICHGLIDENVHFRHAARLINALIEHSKHHETLLFPEERHQPRGAKGRQFMEERLLHFVQSNL